MVKESPDPRCLVIGRDGMIKNAIAANRVLICPIHITNPVYDNKIFQLRLKICYVLPISGGASTQRFIIWWVSLRHATYGFLGGDGLSENGLGVRSLGPLIPVIL